jgi:hypothetical protein
VAVDEEKGSCRVGPYGFPYTSLQLTADQDRPIADGLAGT